MPSSWPHYIAAQQPRRRGFDVIVEMQYKPGQMWGNDMDLKWIEYAAYNQQKMLRNLTDMDKYLFIIWVKSHWKKTDRNGWNRAENHGDVRIFDLVQYGKPRLPEMLAIDEFKGNTGGEKYQCILKRMLSSTYCQSVTSNLWIGVT